MISIVKSVMIKELQHIHERTVTKDRDKKVVRELYIKVSTLRVLLLAVFKAVTDYRLSSKLNHTS